MNLEEAIKIIKDIDVLDDMELKEAYETVLQEIERLQKENEVLKEIDLTTVYLNGVSDEKDRWRNKIREIINNKIKGLKEKIYYEENVISILESLIY